MGAEGRKRAEGKEERCAGGGGAVWEMWRRRRSARRVEVEQEVVGEVRVEEEAVRRVEEALQGRMRVQVALGSEVVQALRAALSFELARVELEAKCGVTQEAAKGEVEVVGPVSGVQLVQRRVWEQLAELFPEQFCRVAMEEAVQLGIKVCCNTMKRWVEQHGVEVVVEAGGILIRCPLGNMEEVAEYVSEQWQEAQVQNIIITLSFAVLLSIIGPCGSVINEMMNQSGARLHILRDDTMHLSGTREAIAKASELVKEKMKAYDNTHKTFQIVKQVMSRVKSMCETNLQQIQKECVIHISISNEGQMTIIGFRAELVEKE